MRRLTLMNPILVAAIAWSCPQQETPPLQAPQGQTAASPSRDQSSSNDKARKQLGFLITGTVFNEHAMSYPNVRVQVRCAGEKKYRWETFTNSRGEFALRVPEGRDYEILVREKNYHDILQTVSTLNSDNQTRLSIRLAPKDMGKTGAGN